MALTVAQPTSVSRATSTSLELARERLAPDPRVELLHGDGDTLLPDLVQRGVRFDLIFADSWPGKYRLLDEALELVADRGVYVIDDMLPQPNWPDGHGDRAAALLQRLSRSAGLDCLPLAWSTGIVLVCRRERATFDERSS